MQRLGLTQAALAKHCDVSKEAVSNWLSGENIPRPNKLKVLAEALQVTISALLEEQSSSQGPVVAYRTRQNRPVTGEASEAAYDVGQHLEQLVPFIQRDTVFAPSVLVEPSLNSEYIREAARQVRSRIGLTQTEPLTRAQLLELLHDFGAILVPVLWGKERDGHENALSVYLPDSKISWVVFNLNARDDDFNYWLAHELGHCYTLHKLQGDDGETFAEKFAQELLFPLEAASDALAVISSDPTPRERANWFAGKYEVSVVTIIKQADAAAALKNLPATGLATRSFWASWKTSRHLVPTLTDTFFGKESLSAAEYVLKCEDEYKTPIFRALSKWQHANEGRSPAFIAGALNIEINQAFELSHFLMSIEVPSAIDVDLAE